MKLSIWPNSSIACPDQVYLKLKLQEKQPPLDLPSWLVIEKSHDFWPENS